MDGAGNGNGSAGATRPAMISWDDWLRQTGITHTTGWRWRKLGWISPANICGRLYLSATEIDRFVKRAEAGEFAKEHKTPRRTTQHLEAA